MELTELIKLANAADRGPWVSSPGDEAIIKTEGTGRVIARTVVSSRENANMRFIAAVDPETVLDLAERLREAEAAMRQASDDLYHGPVGQPYESERMIDWYFNNWYEVGGEDGNT